MEYVFQQRSQGEIRPFHSFVLVTFCSASLWQPPIQESRTVCFINHQDIFFWLLTNPWNSFYFVVFHCYHYFIYIYFFAVIFADKPWRQTWLLFVWSSAARKRTRKKDPFCCFQQQVLFPAKKRTTVTPARVWTRTPTCDDLQPSSAKLNAKWCEKRICWRDSLISRMCDHTLKLCTFPFPPRCPCGLLLRINAPRPLLLFSRPAQVLSLRGIGEAVSLTATQSSQIMKHRVLRMWQEIHICVSLICRGVVSGRAAQK